MAGIPGYSKRYHPSLVIVQICFPGDRCTTLLLDIYNHTQFEATFLELPVHPPCKPQKYMSSNDSWNP